MDRTEYIRTVETYANDIYRVAFCYCRNKSDAEDIVQSVFLKLLQTEQEFQDELHKKRWLLRVTANQAKDFCASYWKQKVVSMETAMSEAGVFMNAKEPSALYEAVMSLSSKYKPVVHLYYYEDYSVKEIAEILGIQETAVQTRLMRARQKLKKVLKEAWQDE